MRVFPALFVLWLLSLSVAASATVVDRFGVFSGIRVPYKVVLPEGFDPNKEYPAILAFSGGGQTLQTVNDVIPKNWVPEAEQRGYLVFLPAASDGQLFFDAGDRIFPHFLEQILKDYRILSHKFYVAGRSNGGISALHVAALYPQYFLSVTAYPGYFMEEDLPKAAKMGSIPILLLVGDQDALMFDNVRKQAPLLKSLGLDVTLQVERGQPHELSTLMGSGQARLFDLIEHQTHNDDGQLIPKATFLQGRDDWRTGFAVKSWSQDGPRVVFDLTGGKSASIRFASDSVYEWRMDPKGPLAPHPSAAVVNPVLSAATLDVSETTDDITIHTKELTVIVHKSDFRLETWRGDALLFRQTKGVQVSGRRFAVFGALDPGSLFHGMGEKASTFTYNGRAFKMWNTDAYGFAKGADPLYMSVPFFLNTAAHPWGVFLDNSHQTYFNFGYDNKDELYYGATDGELDSWFFGDADVPSVLRDYTAVTGRIAMPPGWALGYHQSRYSYMTQDEVLSIAKTFREKDLQASVLYLDIDYMQDNRSFTVNKTAFPDMAGMTKTLHAMGFKVVAIVDPGIKQDPGNPIYDSGLAADVFCRDAAGKLLTGQLWPGTCVFPDFTKPAARTWWGSLYQGLVDMGIDGFWNDMNEPSVFDGPASTLSLDPPYTETHNLYGQLMVQATREGVERLRPDQRLFVLSRAGYAGAQRSAAYWTGDNSATWDHLKLHLTMVMNLGLSGFALTGADVGGFRGDPTPELFVRWMQLGSLMPYFRNHTGKNNARHEPWAFGPQVEDLSRQALNLRAELEPYLYDLSWTASQTGAPLVRPLFWHFPDDPRARDVDSEFLLGEALLAAPILTQGATTVTVYLPAGSDWYDWWTGKLFPGGQTLTLPVTLGSQPLFARAGSVVPVRRKGAASLSLRVFPGAGPAHELFVDDDQTNAYKAGNYQLSRLTVTSGNGTPLVDWKVLHDQGANRVSQLTAVLPDGSSFQVKPAQ